MTEKRQKATKVRSKHNVYHKTVKIRGINHSLEEAFEFCQALQGRSVHIRHVRPCVQLRSEKKFFLIKFAG